MARGIAAAGDGPADGLGGVRGEREPAGRVRGPGQQRDGGGPGDAGGSERAAAASAGGRGDVLQPEHRGVELPRAAAEGAAALRGGVPDAAFVHVVEVDGQRVERLVRGGEPARGEFVGAELSRSGLEPERVELQHSALLELLLGVRAAGGEGAAASEQGAGGVGAGQLAGERDPAVAVGAAVQPGGAGGRGEHRELGGVVELRAAEPGGGTRGRGRRRRSGISMRGRSRRRASRTGTSGGTC